MISSVSTQIDSFDVPHFHLHHGDALASVSLHGAHVTSYRPHPDQPDMIWSHGHRVEPGKDCWGGIPIVWPWFLMGQGEKPTPPFHGFAKKMRWTLAAQSSPNNDCAWVQLELRDSGETRRWWDEAFHLVLRVELKDSLHLTLTTHNTGSRDYRLAQCFHTYYNVGDIAQCSLEGLDGVVCQDNRLEGSPRSAHTGTLALEGPIARFYHGRAPRLQLVDPVWRRRIEIEHPQQTTTILWNSGPVREEGGRTTGEEGWRTQLAIEPLVGVEEPLIVPAGGRSVLELHIRSVKE